MQYSAITFYKLAQYCTAPGKQRDQVFIKMLKEERLQSILNRLSKDNKVTLRDLSVDLHVSEYTIRRDIKELSDQGLLKAVRGGAVPHSPVPHHFSDRLEYGSELKKIIAQKAVKLIQPRQVIIFDGGTTALAVANLLPRDLDITAVTNSFPVASVLENHPHVNVLFAVGKLFKNAFTTVGHDCIRFFEKIRADICFMGICSIHAQLGVTTIDYEESEVKKTMVDVSKHVVALAPLERMNTAEAYFICPTSSLDTIVSDSPEDEGMQYYIDSGVKVI